MEDVWLERMLAWGGCQIGENGCVWKIFGWYTTLFMEDYLDIFENGRRPQFFENGRRPQFIENGRRLVFV